MYWYYTTKILQGQLLQFCIDKSKNVLYNVQAPYVLSIFVCLILLCFFHLLHTVFQFNIYRGVAQFGRVLGLGPRCRRFESCRLDHQQKNPPENFRVDFSFSKTSTLGWLSALHFTETDKPSISPKEVLFLPT